MSRFLFYDNIYTERRQRVEINAIMLRPKSRKYNALRKEKPYWRKLTN